eukprot:CFRG6427T1
MKNKTESAATMPKSEGRELNGSSEPSNQADIFTMPGVLSYLQSQWIVHEREKAHWVVERASYKSRLTQLEGEKKASDRIKHDLVRRIKMLEHALKREWGISGNTVNKMTIAAKNSNTNTAYLNPNLNPNHVSIDKDVTGVKEESTSHILTNDVVSAGVNNDTKGTAIASGGKIDGSTTNLKDAADGENSPSDIQVQTETHSQSQTQSQIDSKLNTKPTALKELTQIVQAKRATSSEFLKSYLLEMQCTESYIEARAAMLRGMYKERMKKIPTALDPIHTNGCVDVSDTGVLFDDLKPDASVDTNGRVDRRDTSVTKIESKCVQKKNTPFLGSGVSIGSDGVSADAVRACPDGDLGQLHTLTLDDDDSRADDEDKYTVNGKAKKWKVKYALAGHTGAVRCVLFHTTDPIAFSGSDDCTIKIWALSRRSSPSGDREPPLYSFSGHTDAVLDLAICLRRNLLLTASVDQTVIVWKIPDLPCDPGTPHDPSSRVFDFTSHASAVSSLDIHPNLDIVASASKDGDCFVWSIAPNVFGLTNQTTPPIKCQSTQEAEDCAHTVSFINTSIDNLVVAYASGDIVCYSSETGEKMFTYSYEGDIPSYELNHIVTHHTEPLLVAGYADGSIRMFDTDTGDQTHMHMAHPDSITRIAIDPTGLYYMTSSRDKSLRLWAFETRRCVQEIGTTHRQKGPDSIHTVAWHSVRNFVASGGADGVIKVYTS